MVIKRSSAGEIDALLADLGGDNDVRRETAIARLAVIGTRAVSGLIDVLQRAPSVRARLAALQALEGSQDPRALDGALACLDMPETAVAVQAVSVVRQFLASSEGPRVIDRLAAIALTPTGRQALRLAALDALADMPTRTVQPIWRRLQNDADALVAHRARHVLGLDEPEPPSLLDAAAAGMLPEDAQRLRTAIATAGTEAPLSTLHRILEVLRGCEDSAREERAKTEWRGARAALHHVLASRGSTVALYDLRETLERASGRVPAEFIAALSAIGDKTCLDATAAAYARAAASPARDEWWRAHLVTAFREIVHRERLTERHAALKHIRAKWPEAAAALLGPPRSRRRPR